MPTLNEIPFGKKVKVISISGEKAVKRRIMDMGFTKGVEVVVKGAAPLGDPLDIVVRGYHLSIRREDAQSICVE